MSIIELAQDKLGLPDEEVEVEYQESTIGTYGLSFNGESFILKNLQTDCLAKDNCGIPVKKVKIPLGKSANDPCCTPNSGCC